MVSDHLHSISQMVRTRATTTVPTPTSARQEASEPATGAVARGRVTARGRGRGRGRASSRGRGRTPGPSGTRAVTPPPTEEVVREGDGGENEQAILLVFNFTGKQILRLEGRCYHSSQ